MLYREIIAVCSQTHTKHTNKLIWRPAEPERLLLSISSTQELLVPWDSEGGDHEECCVLGRNGVW